MQLARKRWRAGRKRKEGARFKGGTYLKPDKVDATPELLAHRVKLVGAQNARLGDAGWYIGQLYLRGQLTVHQKDAAEKWQRAARRYEGLLLSPKRPTAVVLDMPMGERVDDPEEFERVKTQYEQCYNAVAARGFHVLRVVLAALKEDASGRVDLIQEGLEALRLELKIG